MKGWGIRVVGIGGAYSRIGRGSLFTLMYGVIGWRRGGGKQWFR